MSQSSFLARFAAPAALIGSSILTACGGGGGGGGSSVGPPPTPTPVPSVSGDMLALSPSRGWNYQGQNTNGQFTISLYTDPQPVNGATPLLAAVVSGFVPTVLTSTSNVDQNLAAVVGFNATPTGYDVAYEVSAGSTALVPGSPQLVPNTLSLGQTFSPYPGVAATVTAVGTAPGAAACSVPGNGATVSYGYNGQIHVVTYVPGCGITAYTTPAGTTYTLISTGTYASVGEASSRRKVERVNALTTARSLLGLEHNDFPAAHLPF